MSANGAIYITGFNIALQVSLNHPSVIDSGKIGYNRANKERTCSSRNM
jgi:hypothetical protein